MPGAENNTCNFHHIAIEGAIGVGKTVLAQRLAETFGYRMLLEKPAENPFLPRFYADPRNMALPTQLHFLFQRAREIKQLQQRDIFQQGYVIDYIFEKDPLFARINLDEDEYALYQQVYSQLHMHLPTPDLVIYLQASLENLLHRIAQRGNDYEKSITRDYLEKVDTAYIDFFYHYKRAPLLIVNTDDFDPITEEQEYEVLLQHIHACHSGRYYLNSSVPV